MSDLLSIGASGLRAYSAALSTVADNVANAQTPGYARRSVQLAEAPTGSTSLLYRNQVKPMGVDINGVVRSVDQWLIEDARLSSGDTSRTETRLAWMSRVETALSNENNNVGTSLGQIFTTADLLSADPNNSTLRDQFLHAVDEVAAGFRAAAGELQSLRQSVGQAGDAQSGQLSTDLATLQDINTALRKARGGSTNQANLMDQRDAVLDKISAQTGIKTSFDDRGVATVQAADSGDLLVGANYTARITASADASGRLSFLIDGAEALTSATGSLAGLSEASHHIADQFAALDGKAVQFSGQLNAAHQSGLDKAGNAGQPLFSGSSAANLTAAALTAAQVAAADASSANGNILAFGALRGEGNPESQWSAHLAAQAQLTAAARSQNAAAATRSEGANAARDMVSEVDLDREAAELLRFQQAYSAAARTIQVARETMQSLLSAL